MTTSLSDLRIRAATREDSARLDEVRQAAFAPVFESFRTLLGDEIYRLSDAPNDAEQATYLSSLLAPGSGWDVHVAEKAGLVVGFVTIQLRVESGVGEIGLNAVDPAWAGEGIGTAMYQFALDRMRAAGVRIATVSTGADPSHEPARRAYAKVGFTAGIPTVWLYQRL